MEKVVSYSDFKAKSENNNKAFLLLYKAGSQQSECACQQLETALQNTHSAPVYIADVNTVRDIHPQFSISSVPSLLLFEDNAYKGVIKGCQSNDYYKALMDNAIYQAKAKAEGKVSKNVTVYSTPTCSWCNTLKTWLRKNGIHFTDIDISHNENAAQELVRRSGQQGVPQTDINGQIVVGFNQQRLKELLEIQ